MSSSRYESTDRFEVKAENGESYWVLESTAFVDTTTFGSSQTEWTEGLKSYRLQSGDPLNLLNDGRFKNVLTGEILTRVK